MSLGTFIVSLFRSPARMLKVALRLGLLVSLLVVFAPVAQAAEGIEVKAATLELADDGWQLGAEFDIQFSPRLEEAVNRGVPLYFVVEFELSRPRWY